MLATMVTAKAAGVFKIPDAMSLREASSTFFSYLTAVYSSMTIGGLEKGQVCDLFPLITRCLTNHSPYSYTAHVAV